MHNGVLLSPNVQIHRHPVVCQFFMKRPIKGQQQKLEPGTFMETIPITKNLFRLAYRKPLSGMLPLEGNMTLLFFDVSTFWTLKRPLSFELQNIHTACKNLYKGKRESHIYWRRRRGHSVEVIHCPCILMFNPEQSYSGPNPPVAISLDWSNCIRRQCYACSGYVQENFPGKWSHIQWIHIPTMN